LLHVNAEERRCVGRHIFVVTLIVSFLSFTHAFAQIVTAARVLPEQMSLQ